jgi:beta-phosphoglucomutase-like phosphatase (HAD superfamily)
MIDFEVKGIIFDVDDTLLDNKQVPGPSLHEQSRLAAVHEAGRKHELQLLAEFSHEDNFQAFRTAKTHSLEGAVWNILHKTGVVESDEIDHSHTLLQEIVTRKNVLHEQIILDEGEALEGAVGFIEALAANGLANHMAIASTAIRRDIDIFLAKTDLKEFFPDERIKSKESTPKLKPDPEVFNLAFSSLGLAESDRAHVCAFEDDPRGVASAKAAGLYVCAITTRYTRSELLAAETPPDLIADTYEEFTRYFESVLQK